jgi:ribosomal protein L37AE/L43A
MKRKMCPKCGNTTFAVTAHVTQDWIVDEDGDFIECINDCTEVTHKPDDIDIWQCNECGYNAPGYEFNVKE